MRIADRLSLTTLGESDCGLRITSVRTSAPAECNSTKSPTSLLPRFPSSLIPAAQRLESAGIERPLFEAQLLLAIALGFTRSDILRGIRDEPSPVQIERFEDLVRQRERRVPLAYLRGTREFFGLEFEVSPAVLIPRPETELLVEFAVEELAARPGTILVDVGTGSGCIAIAAASRLPHAKFIATDQSTESLRIARRNTIRNAVDSRVNFVRGDMLAPLDDSSAEMVVSNPPYIPSDEIAGLQPEIRDFEPREALDGGPDGLDCYRRLIPESRRVLEPGGRLAVEVGIGQAAAVAGIMAESGFRDIEKRRDLAGIDRVVTAMRQ